MVSFELTEDQGRYRAGEVVLVDEDKGAGEGDWIVTQRNGCLICELWRGAGGLVGVIVGVVKKGPLARASRD